jgi:hypothetical protein
MLFTMYSTVDRIFQFLYSDPDYPTSVLTVTALARVRCNFFVDALLDASWVVSHVHCPANEILLNLLRAPVNRRAVMNTIRSGSIHCWEFVDQLKIFQLHMKDSFLRVTHLLLRNETWKRLQAFGCRTGCHTQHLLGHTRGCLCGSETAFSGLPLKSSVVASEPTGFGYSSTLLPLLDQQWHLDFRFMKQLLSFTECEDGHGTK